MPPSSHVRRSVARTRRDRGLRGVHRRFSQHRLCMGKPTYSRVCKVDRHDQAQTVQKSSREKHMQASVQFTTQQVYFVVIKCWGRLHALRRIGPVQLAINHLHLRNYCKTFEPLERTRLRGRVPQTHIVRDLELIVYFQKLKKFQ